MQTYDFSIKRYAFLEKAINKCISERGFRLTESFQFTFAQNSVLVHIHGNVTVIQLSSINGREPVELSLAMIQIIFSQLQNAVQESGVQDVHDLNLARSVRVEKEEELSHCDANVEGVEALINCLAQLPDT